MKQLIEQVKQDIQSRKNQKGATMVEYGVMAALIAGVCILIVTTVGQDVQSCFQSLSGQI